MNHKFKIFFDISGSSKQIIQDYTDVNQKDLIDFLILLVKANTGREIESFSESELKDTIYKCLDLFNKYIKNYLETNFSKSDVIKLKTAKMNKVTNIFDKFNDLQDHFSEAYKSFTTFLKTNTNK